MSADKKVLKFTKAEVDSIIKEEVEKLVAKKNLQNRLKTINEDLNKMKDEDKNLFEVEADGEEKVASHAWTGEANSDIKYKPKFEKKGSSLLEDEEGFVSFETEMAKIGKAIDEKLCGGEDKMDAEEFEMDGEKEGGDDFESIEIEDEPKDKETEEIEVEKEEEPKDEANLSESGENTKKGLEPIEGVSVVQAAEENKVVKNLHKAEDVKEEGRKAYGSILSEGAEPRNKTRLNEEIARNRRLAGLSSDPDGLEIIRG